MISKENPPSKEIPQQPIHGWMFDADGVLFDADDPNIKRPQITEFIIDRLKKGEPVTINSGRAVNFALEKMLPSLQEKGITPELLDNMFFVGQKGAEIGTFVNGELVIEVDESMRIPDYLRENVFKLVRSQFSDTMFEGELKPAMLSPQRRGIEQGKEVPHEEFHREQERLVPMLKEILKNHGVEDKFQVDPTNIATDVESTVSGKDLGARKIISWMKEKDLFPQQFHAFGDSKSDIKMADEIHAEGYQVEFVWAGKKDALAERAFPYQLTMPDGLHDEAIENYFATFQREEVNE